MTRTLARGLAAGFALLACGLASAGINTWTTSGPQGGNFTELERNPTSTNVWYATLTHSFYRSEDGGRTWSETFLPGQAQDIAVDPTNGNRVYVAVVQAGVYRSEDGGRTFTRVFQPNQVWSVGVGGPNGETVYFSGQGQFGRSNDHGNTWAIVNNGFNSALQLIVDRANPELITANFQSSVGLSTDGGVSWSYSNPSPFCCLGEVYRKSATELFVASFYGLHRSVDNGATWTTPLFGSFTTLDALPGDPSVMLATQGFHGWPYRSVDGGATWQPVGRLPQMWYSKRVRFGSGPAFGRLVAGGDEGIHLSSDGGLSWTAATRGPAGTGPYPFAAGKSSDSPIYASNGPFGFYASYDDRVWRQRIGPQSDSSTVDIAVKPDQPNVLLMSPSFIGISRSTDGGTNWVSVGGFQGLDFKLGFAPSDTNRVYAAVFTPFNSPPTRFYASADAGATWSPVASDLPPLTVYGVVVDPTTPTRIFVNAVQGYSGENRGGLYRSVDGGAHFTKLGLLGTHVYRVAIDPDEPSRVYAATNLGLYVSTDGGETFTRNEAFSAVAPYEAGGVVLDPEVTSTIYATDFDSGYFYYGDQRPSTIVRSVDRGATWEILRNKTDAPSYLARDLLIDPADHTRLRASTAYHGLASFEIRNDLGVVITGHDTVKKVGVPASYQARITNSGPYHATRVQVSLRIPAGAANVRWNEPSGGFCGRHGSKLDCEISVLKTGTTNVIALIYTPTQAGTIVARIDADAHERDLNNANNTATATTTATP